MALKVWSLLLAGTLFMIMVVAFIAGFLSILNFALLLCVIMILLVTYISLSRQDPLTKVPTPLELEKMKRKKQEEKSPFQKLKRKS
jgi:hypothetical protein